MELTSPGNDHDEDSDKEPEPPTKVVDRPIGRSSKRNTPDVAPGSTSQKAPQNDRGGGSGRRGGFSGSENGQHFLKLPYSQLEIPLSIVFGD